MTGMIKILLGIFAICKMMKTWVSPAQTTFRFQTFKNGLMKTKKKMSKKWKSQIIKKKKMMKLQNS